MYVPEDHLQFFFNKKLLRYIYHMCMKFLLKHGCLVSVELEEGIRSPESGLRNDCEHFFGCWKSNPDTLQEQVFLTIEVPLQLTSSY